MKKIITKTLVIIFSIGMVISLMLNFGLQVLINIKGFKETAKENFWQIERIIEEKEQELEEIKKTFAEECIIRARAAAYIAQHYPKVVDSLEESRLVASLLQVDELHFFTKEGVIFAGTHPEYYNYSFSSGEQMAFFAPMLKDYSLELCQDITPNTAEHKLMQYTAVWRKDRKGIVQVGLEPDRVLKAIEGNNVSDIFSMISADASSSFYAVDVKTGEIMGSADPDKLGKKSDVISLNPEAVGDELYWNKVTIDGIRKYCAAERSGSLILVKTCPVNVVHEAIPRNTLILCGFFILLFLALILTCYKFLEVRIINSIVNINKKLKQIEQGEWNIRLNENSTEEFTQLSRYINNMVESILDFSIKMSKALEMSKVPIGICEYVPDADRFTTTGRVKDILMMSEEEFGEFAKYPKEFERKRQQMCSEDAHLEENVYRLEGYKERYIRIESFMYNKSQMTILIDVTADVQEKQQIAKERDTDLLTGLYNRRAFYNRMEEFFEKPEKLKYALMVMIDLDHLKMVNDVYGHADGDRYLLALSNILHVFAGKDQKRIAARMGGDEFIFFAYGFGEKKEIETVMEELLAFRDTSELLMENGDSVILEFSIGWSVYPEERVNYQDMIKLADKRMYYDKNIRKRGR